MNKQTTSPAGIALICSFESCRLTAYRCPAGIPTIAWGHTGAGVTMGLTITQARADQLLASDLLTFESAVSSAVCVPLTDGQFSALVSFAYNCRGWRGSPLLKMVNRGAFAEAAEQFQFWNHAGPMVLPGLTARRKAERALFLGEINA